MIKSIIAYDIVELEKKKVLSEARILFKSKLITEDQWKSIGLEYFSKLYTPNPFIRVLLFILAYIGMTTVIGPLALIFSSLEFLGYQLLSLILGLVLLFLTERLLIKDKHHYKSGVTEAGIFSGLSFVAFGILASSPNVTVLYPIVLFFLAAFATVRYLNLVTLISSVVFFGWILFQILTDIGGYAKAFMPFIFMGYFGLIYWYSKKLNEKITNVIFDDLFVVLKTLTLVGFYISGNYFVVRELSIELMGLSLTPKQDIPFAFIFYALTALIPIAYMYLGITQKSILLIRVGVFVTALSVITFKYYFSLGLPIITITVLGAVLIGIALLLFNYLKQIRNGFTQEQLLKDKWSSQDLTAIIASQTLGGNTPNSTVNTEDVFKGGQFGGGGASSNW